MVNIQSPTAEIRRGKKRKIERNYMMKIYMVSLLHRATINKPENDLVTPHDVGCNFKIKPYFAIAS